MLLLLLLSMTSCYAQDTDILPCVINGACSLCSSPGSVNCPKCSFTDCVRKDRDDDRQVCPSCDNQTTFCGATESQLLARDVGYERFFSVYIPRSVGANTARELAGWEEFINLCGVGDYYLTTGHVVGYSRSFRPERIARSLFGTDRLSFAGSQVADRGNCELLADNFGLSPFMRGHLSIKPTIENIFFDNQFFLGLDPICSGLYLRLHAPLVHTRWSLDLRQTIDTKKCEDFPACAVGENEVDASCNIIKALSGDVTFGDMTEPWRYGRFACGTQTKTALADIDVIMGYNYFQSDIYHLGFYGLVVIPTGNKPEGRTIFEPIVGNGRHWELGLGLSGHTILWERDANQNLALYVEGNVTHLFKNTQCRSFDFKRNGSLSRYMLLKEIVDNEYTGRLVNAINLVTRPTEVSIPVKGEVSVKLAFRSPCIIFDLGYNFYGQTKEKIHCIHGLNERPFGVKGTEGTCGLAYQIQGTEPPFTFGPLEDKPSLNSTQSAATIRSGARTDNGVDLSNENTIVVTAYSRQQGVIEGSDVQRAFASNPPVLIGDLDQCSGRMPTQASHKVFGYLGYNFATADWCYNPYLGLGGELEVDALACNERFALNQWSLWIKGGFEF